MPEQHFSTRQRWIVVAGILLAASLIQVPIVLNPDLGWLLTANEKILDGRKLGVDLFESNPPLSVYMYMPAVMLSPLSGIAPKFIVIAMLIAEIAGTLVIIDRAAAAARLEARERSFSAWLFAFLLAVLPGTVFGQREHIAVIALTPFVAVTALRWRGLSPGPAAILAGVGAGLAMGIKPFFALVAGFPIILRVIRERSLRPLVMPEACIAAAGVIGYGALVVVLFPAYVSTYAPMVAEAYLPIRKDLASLLPLPVVVLSASLAFLRLLAPRDFRIGGDAAPWLAASLGGAASFIIQGKAWPYTALALCLLAIAAPALQLRTKSVRMPALAGALAAVVLIALYLSSPDPRFPPLQGRVQALVKHPRLLTITDHIGLGHPLVRDIDGSWVGSSCAQLLAAGAILRQSSSHPSPAEQARLDSIISFERQHLLADLRSGRPDVILVDTLLLSSFPFDWLAWANADPELRQELNRYREVDKVGRVRILIPRSGSDQ